MENCRDTSVAVVANGAADSARPALDLRAMDALVNAVEARLREHDAQVDRRLADLEASMAIELESLRHEEHATAGRAQTALEQVLKELSEQTLALWQQRKEDLAALRQEFTSFQTQFVAEIAATLETQVASQVDAAAGNLRKLVEAAAAERLDPLVAEIGACNREIAGLRQRVAEGERDVLEIVLAMGEWFRELAKRMCNPRPSAPQPPSAP